jgi:CubicO group peptidase (beta-lactamase class C family)
MASTALAPKPVALNEWPVRSPESAGLDPAKLRIATEAVRRIEQRYGFLIVKDGAIVHEAYFEGSAETRHKVFSMTKGFGASLVGIAQTKGLLSVRDKVFDWLPIHHPDIKAGATIEHILAMTAAGNPDLNSYQYTSGPILNSLPNILWLASGRSPAQFYEEELAAPLGLTMTWPRTAKGWMQIGNRGPMPVLEATHRDCARLGQLWLDKGVWNGTRLIDEAFVDAALRPPFPEANMAYGYLWWLNKAGGIWRDPLPAANPREGKRVARAPENFYSAQGARGKLMFVIPDQRMIVVTLGETVGEYQPTQDLWAAIEPLLS